MLWAEGGENDFSGRIKIAASQIIRSQEVSPVNTFNDRAAQAIFTVSNPSFPLKPCLICWHEECVMGEPF